MAKYRFSHGLISVEDGVYSPVPNKKDKDTGSQVLLIVKEHKRPPTTTQDKEQSSHDQ